MKALMQILKWALITMLAFTSFNLFISPEYKVERSVEINVPAYIVYEQVTDLHQWENWAVWWKNDTSMITNYSGAERGLGAKMDWIDSDEIKGALEITSCSLEGMETQLNFDSFPVAYGFWKFDAIDGGTKVTWGMNGEMSFFFRFMTLFFDKMAGPDFDKGLAGLKEVCESIPAKSSEVSIVDWDKQNYIYIENACSIGDIGNSLGTTYGELFGFVGENGLQSLSGPFAKWISFPVNLGDEDKVVFQASVMIDKDALDNMLARKHGIIDSWVADPYKHLLEKEYGILLEKTIAGKTLQATHFGAYEMSAVTHNKIYEFADANEISLSNLPYEFYTNDPTTCAPEDVETLIIYEIIN
ncbi:MAG: SRPBCC family protein [Flavobacteriales bacterium]|nr:SRPBCC family protein [Flavobacteriales bacterium]